MPKIPSYDAQVNPEAALPGENPDRVYAQPESFGGGKGLASVGAGLSDVTDTLYDAEQRQEVSDVRVKMATLRGTLTASFEQQASQAAPGDPAFADKFMGNVTNQLATMGGTLNTRAGMQAFQQESASLTSDFLAKSTEHQVQSAGVKAVTDFQTTVNQNAGTLFNDPTQFDSIMKSMDANFSDPNSAFANVPAEEKGKLELAAKESLAVAAARGVAMMNPDLAEKLYKAGQLPGQSFMTEAGNAQTISYITTMQNAQRTKQALALAQQEKQERIAQENAEVNVLRHLEKNPSDPGNVDMILHSGMKAPAMLTMLELAKHVGGPDDNHDANTYGPGFLNAYEAVHSGKVTTPDQLYPLVRQGNLTVAGVNMLTGEIQGKRTPEGENETQMKQGFVAAMRQQISGTNSLTHLKDSKGDMAAQSALTWFLPAYDKAKADGKIPPSQLLDPNNPHSLWNGAMRFKRSPQQQYRDMLSDNPGVSVGPAPPAAPTYKSAADVSAAYKAGKIDRATAGGILTQNGWAH